MTDSNICSSPKIVQNTSVSCLLYLHKISSWPNCPQGDPSGVKYMTDPPIPNISSTPNFLKQTNILLPLLKIDCFFKRAAF